MASKFYRWAKQLYKTADIMEMDEAPKPKPALRPLCKRRLTLN